MAPQDKAFYIELGQRIAQYRKAQGLTQTELAEQLGIAQQTMAHYEGGHLRIAVSMLSDLAKALSISVDEILNEQTTKKKPGPTSLLQRQMEEIRTQPRTKQKVISEMLQAILDSK